MSDCGMKDLLSGEENVILNSIDCLRAVYKKTREIEQLMMFIYYDHFKIYRCPEIRNESVPLWAIFTFETDECYRFRSDLTKA